MQFNGKKVLLLGSGGLRIGQAGEFDYSGSQAIKALKEEGIHVVLANPNIATVQTDANMADTLYLQPLNMPTITDIIEKEKPDGILLGFGGQTALNLGLALHKSGVLAKYNVRVLGTEIASIQQTEDRDLFKQALESIHILSPRSICVTTVDAALTAAEEIGYPIMMRSGFSLGGLGSGKIANKTELLRRAKESLASAPQILIEEYLLGWKEFEYEIVRDVKDNALTICNMENVDPMGVHTGESIVVAPAQTLNNREHQKLRNMAIAVARLFKIVGECNIQFAVNPENGDYRVIEMNARLSRSSALASKATGYPLAFVATKLALGYALHEIKNSVTQKTCAYFEPALDYIVVKIPRWDTHKLKAAERTIGTEMKSVGEVMGIGRSAAFNLCVSQRGIFTIMTIYMQTSAHVLLQSGEVFCGEAPAHQVNVSFGEIVFTTGMVGYTEALTDPSYAGQILVFTYPLMGNYGVAAPETWESQKIHARGVIMSELTAVHSNHAAEYSLRQWLEQQHIPYITGVDTRALTKCLRTKGVVPGAIAPQSITPSTFEDFEHMDWVKEVSIKEPQYYGSGDKLVIAIDCGMKENILRSLLRFPIRIKRVPYNYDFTDEEYDGVFISNGPGDPVRCQETVAIISKVLAKKKPTFGICLGTQLMALAVGAKTYKLTFGHRSHNQPCLDLQTERAYLTSQNHGYAVDEKSLPQDWKVLFRNLNDQSVAGIIHQSLPFFSVQFHPEAAPGPEDTQWLFEKFYESLRK